MFAAGEVEDALGVEGRQHLAVEMTARLKLGAYSWSRSKQRSAKASRWSSQEPSRSSYGA